MVKAAVAQFTGNIDKETNIQTAIRHVRDAASQGAQIICLPELFNTMFFPVDERPEYFEWAEPVSGETINRMSEVAREVEAVLVSPIFERSDDGKHYNTAVVIGPDGDVIGKYRKTHIPFMNFARDRGPRGNEKFYFEPGDLGYPTFDTPFGVRIGILICYDRHFVEAARALGLNGADIVFIPAATNGIGGYDWKLAWQVELQAMAISNIFHVCVANKVGIDVGGPERNHFGNSLMISPRGEILVQASGESEDVLVTDLDPTLKPYLTPRWGYYENRRPDLYKALVDPVVQSVSTR